MAKKRIFISFDFDHDEDLRNLLVGQSRNEDSPFEIANWSVKEPMTGDWKEKVRTRIKQVDKGLVICGYHTDTASGVTAEAIILHEEGKIFYLFKGRATGTCKKPKNINRPMYDWTWANLKTLLG